ncbi:MAG: hypothetical protein HKN92_10050 [Chitinophagales bacterium]|nr:hypothetical protein [Chitinophagales bacterium]
MKHVIANLLLILIMTVSTMAQERSLVTLNMKNGDVLTGYTSIVKIPFATDYGNLAFPAKEVRKIVLGVSSEGVDRDVLYEQLDKIQFGALEESERAFDRLVEKDENILPMLRDYIESPDYEKKLYNPFNIELLYQILLEKYDLESDFSERDIIHFGEEHSVVGEYKFESITVDSKYGEFTVPRSSVGVIEIVLQEDEMYRTKTFKLLADQHISANRSNGWLKTGVLVKKGDNLTINATGEIVLESLDGNTYTADGGVNGSKPPSEKGPLFGNVVFKIGEKGPTRIAGNLYKAKSEATGILYLSIYESVYNSGNKGNYEVKLKVNQLD